MYLKLALHGTVGSTGRHKRTSSLPHPRRRQHNFRGIFQADRSPSFARNKSWDPRARQKVPRDGRRGGALRSVDFFVKSSCVFELSGTKHLFPCIFLWNENVFRLDHLLFLRGELVANGLSSTPGPTNLHRTPTVPDGQIDAAESWNCLTRSVPWGRAR